MWFLYCRFICTIVSVVLIVDKSYAFCSVWWKSGDKFTGRSRFKNDDLLTKICHVATETTTVEFSEEDLPPRDVTRLIRTCGCFAVTRGNCALLTDTFGRPGRAGNGTPCPYGTTYCCPSELETTTSPPTTTTPAPTTTPPTTTPPTTTPPTTTPPPTTTTTARPTTPPVTSPPPPTTTTSAPTTPTPTTTRAPSTTSSSTPPSTTAEANILCGCYPTEICQILDEAGAIDIRIVTPVCPAGMTYCCPSTFRSTTPGRIDPRRGGQLILPEYSCGLRETEVSTHTESQTSYGSYPWLAAILTKNNSYIGAGVLVQDQFIITAAHLIANLSNQTLKIRLGEWNTDDQLELVAKKEFVTETIFIHPGFNRKSLINDVAIIQLNDSISLSSFPLISNACLPKNTYDHFVGQRCWVAGWGGNAFNLESYQVVLTEVEVPIVSGKQCENRLRKTRLGRKFILDASFLCAGGEKGKDACTGDGGAPLVCNENGHWSVVGLVSWDVGCDLQDIPRVFTNVPSLMSWIKPQITLL